MSEVAAHGVKYGRACTIVLFTAQWELAATRAMFKEEMKIDGKGSKQ